MTTATERRTPADRRFVRSQDVTEVGSVAGNRYITIDGLDDEWIVGGRSPEPAGLDGVYIREDIYAPEDVRKQLPVGQGYRRLSPVPAGSYEAALTKATKPTKADDPRPVDALAVLGPLARRYPVSIVTNAPRSQAVHAEARPPIRGVEPLIAFLERRGVTIALSASGEHIIATAPAGRLDMGLRAVVAEAAPLLLAYRKGKPLMCDVAKHDREAVTILAGGAPACEECAP